MANLASLLKDEISRLSRKEVKAETDTLKKSSSRYRSDIAELKRRVDAIERQLAKIERLLTRQSPVAAVPETSKAVRFSPKGLRTQRERLELSAAEFGKLLDVSGQTIYNWEAGNPRPSPDKIKLIAALRKLSKRDVQEILAR